MKLLCEVLFLYYSVMPLSLSGSTDMPAETVQHARKVHVLFLLTHYLACDVKVKQLMSRTNALNLGERRKLQIVGSMAKTKSATKIIIFSLFLRHFIS